MSGEHKNTRLTFHQRIRIVRRLHAGERPSVLAREFGVSRQTIRKWKLRFEIEKSNGLQNREARPISSPTKTSVALIAQVKQLNADGLRYAEIVKNTGLSKSTISRIVNDEGPHSVPKRTIEQELNFAYLGLSKDFRRQIDKLTEQQRRAILLVEILEYTQEEAAVRIGISRDTVKEHIARARNALRNGVSPKG